MNRTIPTLLAAAYVAALTLSLAACDDDVADAAALAAPRLEVRLTDGPGDYEAVVVDVVGVEVRRAGADGDGFEALPAAFSGPIDLLELSNGADTLLAAGDFEAGAVDEVRLRLGDDNYVVVDGDRRALSTPSAQQSGLKVKVEGDALVPGRAYAITLDFDAGRSVVRAGNSGRYNLKPVLRATLREVDAPAGARIVGRLTPAERQYVFAHAPLGDTIGSIADSLGAFALLDVPAGTYTVEVVAPEGAAYGDRVIEGVAVSAGEVEDLGLIELE